MAIHPPFSIPLPHPFQIALPPSLLTGLFTVPRQAAQFQDALAVQVSAFLRGVQRLEGNHGVEQVKQHFLTEWVYCEKIASVDGGEDGSSAVSESKKLLSFFTS
jgi:hypothetical protein